MSKGDFRVGFYIDDRADARQREALSHIFSFQPGGAFVKIAGVVGADLGVKVARITFEANGKQRKLSVAGIAEADIRAITGLDNKEVVIENTKPFPLVAARSNHASYNDHAIQMDVSGKNGFYSPFAYSSV